MPAAIEKKHVRHPPCPLQREPADFRAINKNMPQKLVASPRCGIDVDRIGSGRKNAKPVAVDHDE
jgi:hypothetical protein